MEVVIHQTATSVRCQLSLINASDERVLNERGKWESWVIIRKALFSAYRCLLFILHHGWGQNALIGDLNKLRRRVFSWSGARWRLKMWLCFFSLFFFSFVILLLSGLSRLKAYFLCAHCFVSTLSFIFTSTSYPRLPFSHSLLLASVSPGCPAIWWRQPAESAGEGEVGSLSHAALHPSGLSEPSPRHDRSGRL